jgi:hypothetical protein
MTFAIPALEAFRRALDAPGPAAFAALEELARAPIGHALFTANAFRAETMEVERLYSSRPDAYPVGGRKKKRDTEWGAKVLIGRQVVVSDGEAAIRRHFDDADLILSLGLNSMINVPVTVAGRCFGTLNFSATRPAIGGDAEAAARALGLMAVPLFQHLAAS